MGEIAVVMDGAQVASEELRAVPVRVVPVTVDGMWAARLCPYGLGPQRAAWVAGFLAGWVGAVADGNPWSVDGLRAAWESGRRQAQAQRASV